MSSDPGHPDDLDDAAETELERERHATNLELFLDLAFVFAVTQIATYVSHHLDWSGVGRGALLAWLVWWMWSQFTWAGTAIDLQERAPTRIIVLATIPMTLVLGAALPGAFDDDARWFGATYLIVQLLVFAMQGVITIRTAATRSAFVRYASLAIICPFVVFVGGFMDADERAWWWCAAAAIGIAGALRASGAGEWTINPSHFAERHSLFIIICLGETLVAVGASATSTGLDGDVVAGLVVASAVACVVWWMYFAFIPQVVERELRVRPASTRGTAARDLFTFGHSPIVGGIIGFAVVAKHMVPHPTDDLPTADRALFAASIALIVGGHLGLQWRVVRHLAPERIAAIAAVAALCAAATTLDGVTVVAAVAVILLVMQLVTSRRFFRGELARELTG